MSNNPYRFVLPEIVGLLASKDLYAQSQCEPTRAAYARTILDIGEQDSRVVVLDADVSKSIGTNKFAQKFPDRSFNFGIAEQNMFAAAAGMATTGLIPFASTYAVFASLRALDMVRNSIHYPCLNVKIAASHSGTAVAAAIVDSPTYPDMTSTQAQTRMIGRINPGPRTMKVPINVAAPLPPLKWW